MGSSSQKNVHDWETDSFWIIVRWYVPENATLFIVGDIDEEETIQQVTRMVKASESLPRKYYVNTR